MQILISEWSIPPCRGAEVVAEAGCGGCSNVKKLEFTSFLSTLFARHSKMTIKIMAKAVMDGMNQGDATYRACHDLPLE